MPFPRISTESRSSNGPKFSIAVAFSAAIVLLIGLQVFNLFSGFDPNNADIKNDWVVASAMVDGANPYSDLNDLADTYAPGSYVPPPVDPEVSGVVRTPRTPGAILMAVPLTLIPIDRVVQVNNLLTLAASVIGMGVIVIHRYNPYWQMSSALLVMSSAMLWNLGFSAVSMIVALLTTFAVIRMSEHDSVWIGLAIAISVTLKAFPAVLLVLALLKRKYTSFWSALCAIAIINFTPLLLPGLALGDAFDAIAGASARFAFLDSNMSLVALGDQYVNPIIVASVAAAVVVSLFFWVARTSSNLLVDGTLLLAVSILVSPLSWPHYALIVLPLAVGLLLARDTPLLSKIFLVASFGLSIPSGSPWPTALAVVAIAIGAAIARARPPHPHFVENPQIQSG